jgi:hypothetical protein
MSLSTDRLKIMSTRPPFARALGVNRAARNNREMFMRSDLRRIFLTTLAATAFSATALAGFRTGQQVVMMDQQKMVNGDVGYVHQSADDVQYIGCFTAGYAGYCFASNRDGVTRSCWSDEPRWVNAMSAVGRDTYLVFYYDDAGYCTYVSARNGSVGEPR